MKRYLTLAAIAGILAGVALPARSVDVLIHGDSGQLRPAGTVSVTGAANLDDLQAKLAEKAREEGAKGMAINAAGGENRMYGTATIYK